jgi:hypothetical protein
LTAHARKSWRRKVIVAYTFLLFFNCHQLASQLAAVIDWTEFSFSFVDYIYIYVEHFGLLQFCLLYFTHFFFFLFTGYSNAYTNVRQRLWWGHWRTMVGF